MKILKIDNTKSNKNKQSVRDLNNIGTSKPNMVNNISDNANEAIKQNFMAMVSFNGRTVYPIETVASWEYGHTTASTPKSWHYEVEKGAIPTRENITAGKASKIYIADPDEIIPEEIFKTHDFVKRTDMHLEQIRQDYRNGYKNFAQNAQIEKNHFQWLKTDAKERLDKNLSEKEHRTKALELIEQETPAIKAKLINKYNEEIKTRETKMEKANIDLSRANDKIQKASQRFELLVELDNLGGEKTNLINKQKDIKEAIDRQTKEQHHCVRGHIPQQKLEINNVISKFKAEVIAHDKNKDTLNKAFASDNLVESPDKLKLLEKAKAKIEAKFQATKIELKEKLKNEKIKLAKLNEELAIFSEQLKNMDSDFAHIDSKLDNVFSKVEHFYKHNYSHWCR